MFEHEYTIEQLKSYFLTGLKPTEEQFARFIKECYNNDEEVIAALQSWTTDELNALKSYVDEADQEIIDMINRIAARIDHDFDVSYNIGGYNQGDIITSGTTVQDVVEHLLHTVFQAEAAIEPSAVVSINGTSGDTYYVEVGTTFTPTIESIYNDGKLLTWNHYTSGYTDSLNSVSTHYPQFYIDGELQTGTGMQCRVPITVPKPSSVTQESIVPVYTVQEYDTSTGVAKNSDDTVGTAAVFPASECTAQTMNIVGRFMYFGGYTTKAGYDAIIDSDSVRALTTFSGFIDRNGVEVTRFNERQYTRTDGSEFYLVVAVPDGYGVSVDNEASMETPMSYSAGTIAVYTGGGMDKSNPSLQQQYRLFFTPQNGATFRNLYIYKE